MSVVLQSFRLCLALILTLTLSHATVARNQGGTIAGWIALCAGADVVSVAVDGQGVPVAPHLPCPDCIMAGTVLLPQADPFAWPVRLSGRIAPVATLLHSHPDIAFTPAARGPPSFG